MRTWGSKEGEQKEINIQSVETPAPEGEDLDSFADPAAEADALERQEERDFEREDDSINMEALEDKAAQDAEEELAGEGDEEDEESDIESNGAGDDSEEMGEAGGPSDEGEVGNDFTEEEIEEAEEIANSTRRGKESEDGEPTPGGNEESEEDGDEMPKLFENEDMTVLASEKSIIVNAYVDDLKNNSQFVLQAHHTEPKDLRRTKWNMRTMSIGPKNKLVDACTKTGHPLFDSARNILQAVHKFATRYTKTFKVGKDKDQQLYNAFQITSAFAEHWEFDFPEDTTLDSRTTRDSLEKSLFDIPKKNSKPKQPTKSTLRKTQKAITRGLAKARRSR